MSNTGTMRRIAVLAAIALAGTAALSPARAATYDWTYTNTFGNTENGSGTLTTGAADMGGFDVATFSSTFDGHTIMGSLPLNTCCGAEVPPFSMTT
jgi:hypothetical protein